MTFSTSALVALPLSLITLILIQQVHGIQYGIPGVDATFDYVVVGGGTSGFTLAARLAEAHFSVALIEAGDFYEDVWPLPKIPGFNVLGVGSSPFSTSPIDWQFVTEPVPGANYRAVHYCRHKTFGGSSAANAMVYQRPDIGSMNRWAELVNDSSYSFDEVLPFYQRTPTFHPPDNDQRPSNATADYNPDVFSDSGEPLHVSYPIDSVVFSTWMARGMRAIGIPETEDFNSGRLLGAQWCPSTIRPKDRTRSSSEAAFMGRRNNEQLSATLTLYKLTMGKRVLFSSDRSATGVHVRTGKGPIYTLHAAREVILSAGAFQSPQLLMVSGIGPPEVLNRYQIPVIVDLPGVGQNLWDHLLFGPSYRVNIPTNSRIPSDPVYTAEQLIRYLTKQRGPFTNHGVDYLAWEKIPDKYRSRFSPATLANLSWFPPSWPETEYLSQAIYINAFMDPFFGQPKGNHMYAGIIGSLVAPTSRGYITLTSNDTDDLPLINPNWLSTESDAEVAIAIYKRIREAWRHPQGVAPIVIEEVFPGPHVQSDEQILEVIRDTVMTIYHAACTCKMGVTGDPMAVVDSQARVLGVQRLRVVDASAFAILPPGHPQSTCYMLAEKIAVDIIDSANID
ncbi:GMC family oxidoreductase [Aspergillus stella-maris]|uniref:GMC family oxidoreductase n=1 Tax=Aspergillus stella-maris TaxID=1810926 RepID=UPI003CCDDD62